MQLALRLVYDINEDLQKLLVRNLEIKWNSILSELVDVDIYIIIYIYIFKWIYWISGPHCETSSDESMILFPDSIEDEILFEMWVQVCKMKEGRHKTFSRHVSLQLHDIAWSLQEQCIVGHQEEFVLTGATGTPWCVLYTVPVLLTCWKCFSIGGLCLTLLWDNPKPGLLQNVKKKCGLPLVKKGHQQLPGCNGLRDARTEAVTTRWILIFWAKRAGKKVVLHVL